MQSFLQSKEWDEFQKSIGRKTWRIDGALVIKHDLPFGLNYLYCPRPNFSDELQVTSGKFFYEVEKIVKIEKSIFLKIDPIETFNMSRVSCCVSHGIQPQKTVIINLSQSESELLFQMREKTRYNIRLAERKGVQIVPMSSKTTRILAEGLETNRESQVTSYFEKFWKLLQETAKRDKFHTHIKQHYERLLAVQSENFYNELFCIEYHGEVLAAAIINFYGNTATYLHGASSRSHKELMAPYLLHWRIIQEAKKTGFAQYDFGGIDEKKWPGVTRFKLGFGGKIFEYPPSVDIIYKPILYKIYQLARKLR